MASGLTDHQKDQYLEDGFLPIEGLFDPASLDPLIAELNEVVDAWAERYHEEGRLSERFADKPFERRLYRIHEAMDGQCGELLEAVLGKRKTAGMFHVMALPGILDVVESLIGPEILVHPQFNSRAKLPDRTSVVDWHQDIGFLDPDVMQTFMVNFWLPLGGYGTNTTAALRSSAVVTAAIASPSRIHPRTSFPAPCPPASGSPVPFPGEACSCCSTPRCTVPRRITRITYDGAWISGTATGESPREGDDVPGFIARSRSHPEKVATGHETWQRLFELA